VNFSISGCPSLAIELDYFSSDGTQVARILIETFCSFVPCFNFQLISAGVEGYCWVNGFFNQVAGMQSTIIAKIYLFHRWYFCIYPQSLVVFIALLNYDFTLVEVPTMISKFWFAL
jgi:hypothetical protein